MLPQCYGPHCDDHALQAYSDIYPHLVTATKVPNLVKIADVDWNDIDAAFCCLPHATTQEVIASLPSHLKIVDLSADFRLQNVDTYREWCGFSGQSPVIFKSQVRRVQWALHPSLAHMLACLSG